MRAHDHDLMAELWGQGMTARQIADVTHHTRSYVKEYSRTHRDDFPARGKGRWPRKLTSRDVRKLVELRDQGLTFAALAKRFGVTKRTCRYHYNKRRETT